MGFDRKLSIKERIIKRRRMRRRRRIFLCLCFLLISTSAYVVINNALGYKDEKTVFSDKEPAISAIPATSIVESSPTAIPASLGDKAIISATDTDEATNSQGAANMIGTNSTDETVEAASTSQVNVNYDKLKSELQKYISGCTGKYGIHYIDLANDYEFGINDTDVYIAASTVKVPLNYYVFKKIAAGEVDPKKTIAYIEDDFEGGTGILQNKKLTGKSFSIKYLLELSITHSDNIATNMLLRYFGRKNLKDYMRSIGGTVVDDKKNVSCPKDMALYMKAVYEFCNNNGELGKELKNNLCNTVYNDRLPKLLPKDVQVAHKVGNQIEAVHDVGIIYADKPYVLTVMSKGVISDEEANNTIAQISKMVYDAVKDR
jgi:beta-lactamase class A